jgi:hypothetical protein
MKTIILFFSILTIILITILIVALSIDITDFGLTIVGGGLISFFLSALEFGALFGEKSLFDNALWDIQRKFRQFLKVMIVVILIANLISFPIVISFRYNNQKSSFYSGFKEGIDSYFDKIKISRTQIEKMQAITVDFSNSTRSIQSYLELSKEKNIILSLAKGRVLVGSIDASTGKCFFNYDLNSYIRKQFVASGADSISNIIIVEKDYKGTNFRYTDGGYGLRCFTNIYFLDPKTSIVLLKLEIIGSDPPSSVKEGEQKKGGCASEEEIAKAITAIKTYNNED